jgi:hypothetical protein
MCFTNIKSIVCFCLFGSCIVPHSPQPPPSTNIFRAVYQSASGEDLLALKTPSAYKASDLKVISKLEINGVVKVENYDPDGLKIFWDEELKMNYFKMTLPTNAGKNPIETYVYLTSTDVDTITYDFQNTTKQYLPRYMFYNKKKIWDVADTPANGLVQPIVVTK